MKFNITVPQSERPKIIDIIKFKNEISEPYGDRYILLSPKQMDRLHREIVIVKVKRRGSKQNKLARSVKYRYPKWLRKKRKALLNVKTYSKQEYNRHIDKQIDKQIIALLDHC